MKQKIFSIYDSKADAYLTPFFLHQEAMAIRVFSDCINSETHQFGKHPEDYTLFSIGTWEDQSGKFSTTNPKSIGNGVEFINKIFEDPNIGDLEVVN